MKPASSVQVGVADDTVWVRVTGRGSFQNSTGLRDFGMAMLKRGLRRFVVDLQGCELMDSTFMGTLTGIGLRLRETGASPVLIINANERNHDLLTNLGLDRILKLEDTKSLSAPAEQLEPAVMNAPRTDQRDTIIRAHEALAAANPENAVRFKDVLDFLKQEKAEESGRP